MADQRPHFYWDFQGADRNGRAILQWTGFEAERAAQGVDLCEGMEILLYEEDEGRDGRPAMMVVDARALFDAQEQRWVAVPDMSTFRHMPIPTPSWLWGWRE